MKKAALGGYGDNLPVNLRIVRATDQIIQRGENMEDTKSKEKMNQVLKNLKITNYLMLATTALLAVTIIVEIIR